MLFPFHIFRTYECDMVWTAVALLNTSMFVLSPPRIRVKVGIQLIGWVPLAPFRLNILGAAARIVPHPTRAVLGRVRHPIVQVPPNVFEAARPLQKVDANRVIPRPLVHTLGGDASHVHRTVIDAHPRHVEQTAPLGAAEPKAEGDILILTPDARPTLATLEAHAPAGSLACLDGSLGARDEGEDVGRGRDVAHERR